MTRHKYGIYEFNLPEGWRIFKNDFHKVDLTDDISDDDKLNFIFCLEDMLLIENNEFIIDLGWYGGKKGQYTIHFFKGTWLVGELLEKYSSKKSIEIANRINEILIAYENSEFDKIKGYEVDENDLNNNSDFADLKIFEPRKN